MKNIQLVKDPLGIQLLNDTYKRICDNDRKKDKVAESACRNKQDGNDRKYQVEICADIRFYDLTDTL